jgi:hypothetical protein
VADAFPLAKPGTAGRQHHPLTGTCGRHEGKPVRLQRQGDSLRGNQRSLPPLPRSPCEAAP